MKLLDLTPKGRCTCSCGCARPLPEGSAAYDLDRTRLDEARIFFVDEATSRAHLEGRASIEAEAASAWRSASPGLRDRLAEAQRAAFEAVGLPISSIEVYADLKPHTRDYLLFGYTSRAVALALLERAPSRALYALVGPNGIFARSSSLTTRLVLSRLPSVPSIRDAVAREAASDLFVEPSIQEPRLELVREGRPAILHAVGRHGALRFAKGVSSVSLFTATSKMASPSFGLPAGLATGGGTCPAVGIRDATEGDKTRVCGVCYARGAHYGQMGTALSQEVRRQWVKESLLKGGASLSAQMAAAIADYAAHARGGGRADQEIGVWKAGSIHVPFRGGMRPATPTPLAIARVGRRSLPATTTGLFSKAPENAIAGFFRVHDSGDFGIGAERVAYVEAWIRVATLLPHVFFWAPTRLWATMVPPKNLSFRQIAWRARYRPLVLPEGRDIVVLRGRAAAGSANEGSEALEPGESPGASIVEGEERPVLGRVVVPISSGPFARNLMRLGALRNFALRPSGLYAEAVGTSPTAIPVVTGADMGVDGRFETVALVGSGVAKRTKQGYPPPMVDMAGVSGWACPVYTQDSGGKERTNCRDAACRACWVARDLPIFYAQH